MSVQNLTKLAIDSVYGYSSEYKSSYDLGKKSVKMTCNACKKTPKTLEDALFVDEHGICLGCDDMRSEYDSIMRLEAQSMMAEMAEEAGFDSVSDYMDMM